MSYEPHNKHTEEMQREYINDVLKNAIVNFNNIQDSLQRTDWKFPLRDTTQINLQIIDNGINNQLAIEVINAEHDTGSDDQEEMRSYIHIGHYDPGLKKFLYYKELIDAEDMDALQDPATEKRNEAIQKKQEYDFDAEVVSTLYLKHREVLQRESLIHRIIEQYNTLPANDKEAGVNEFHIDDSTTYFVCLTKSLKELKGIAVEQFIEEETALGICFQGYLYNKNGVMVRKKSDILQLATRDPNDMEGKFVNNLDLILTKDFTRLVALIDEIEELRITFYKNIDVHNLGLKK